MLDARITREAFLERAQGLGAGPGAYAWLNERDPAEHGAGEFPKKYLPPARPPMGGVHAKLRRIANAGNAARAFDFGDR